MTTGRRASIFEALDFTLRQIVLSPTRRIAIRNVKFTPVADEIYLVPSMLPARSDFVGVGTNIERNIGLFQVNIVGPTEKNAIDQDEVADAVCEHFKTNYKINRNGVLVRIGVTTGSTGGGVPYVSPEIVADGWRTLPVTIPWWCDA